jgi:hypothetical protein
MDAKARIPGNEITGLSMKLLLGPVLLVLSLSACRDSETLGDVAGAYSYEENGEAQAVTVEKDGSYVNSYFRDGSLVWRDEGRWQRDEIDGERGVTFAEFRFGFAGHSGRPGYWFVAPERSFSGNMRLCFDLDLGHCFERE